MTEEFALAINRKSIRKTGKIFSFWEEKSVPASRDFQKTERKTYKKVLFIRSKIPLYGKWFRGW